MSTSNTNAIIEQTEKFGANNYHPLPIVISKAEGVWVESPEGNRYMDMLSAYSAVNQGHRHPKIIQALKDQADKVTLTSRAFHNDQLGLWYEKVCQLTNKNMALPMNTGAEAVETALKAARRWGYDLKGIGDNQAEIIACIGNFHGRTMGAVSLSSDPEYKRGFGPMLPGINLIPYGDLVALKAAITPNTAAFLIEPIQGEAGIIIPPAGFIKAAFELCKENNVLFIADEIQAAYASESQRVVDTANYAISDKQIPLSIDARLKEMNFGVLESLLFTDISNQYGNILDTLFSLKDLHLSAPEGESYVQLFSRTNAAIEEIINNHESEGGNILVFSHGVTIGNYLMQLMKTNNYLHHDNCSVSVVSYMDGDFQVERLADTSFRERFE